jgi:hypothetical protein
MVGDIGRLTGKRKARGFEPDPRDSLHEEYLQGIFFVRPHANPAIRQAVQRPDVHRASRMVTETRN